MNTNPQISIIIPAYNCEKYINRCIDSILVQSFKNFELIIIDDGSKDKTAEIIKKYKDPRIRFYTQKNQGPAKTRNKGIKLAKGKYLMFVDSDDYIENHFVKTYFTVAKTEDYDLVIGGYQKLRGDKVEFVRKLYDGPFAKYIVVGPVCKLYKTQFLKRHKVEFLDTKSSEDVYFSVSLYAKNPKIKIISDTSYYYCYNPQSISNTVHKGFNEDVDILDLMNRINYKKIRNIKLNQYFIIRYIIWYLLYSGRGASVKKFYQEYKKYFGWLEKNIPDFEKNPNIRMVGPRGELSKLGFTVWAFMVLHKMHLVKYFAKIYCNGGGYNHCQSKLKSCSRRDDNSLYNKQANINLTIPAISVIIPVYNAEKYIHKCIDSVLSQTYQNFELILVDDGSKDNSLKILQQYAKKFPQKIRVISQKNHGAGYSRNQGIRLANGEFIAFLDSDDWLASTYLEELLSAIDDCDVAISGYKRYDSHYRFQYEKIPKNDSFAKFKFISTAGKLLRREFLIKNKIKYRDISVGEDCLFALEIYSKTNQIKNVEYAGYCNYENPHSTTNEKKFDHQKTMLAMLKNVAKYTDVEALNQKELTFFMFKSVLTDLFLYNSLLSYNDLKKNYRDGVKWLKAYLHKQNTSLYVYWQRGEEWKINILYNTFLIATLLHLDGAMIGMIKLLKLTPM